MKPMSVRVRFAPSPTGALHVGGVRTALFNWLYAKHHGGKFLLRIEDTDTERSLDEHTKDILECLKWLGLHWDEELIYQSKCLDRHQKVAEDLVKKGHAYYCYCTEAEVDAMREKAKAEGAKPQYDRRCRYGKGPDPKGRERVIRAKIPLDGKVQFEDLIHGVIEFDNTMIDDFVIVRSNGAPTYNHSVVCDDVSMKMTHIIRGDDHINNTPKQVHLYQFMGYPLPKFAHLPMILGEDKKKLSKRHGSVAASGYRREGYLPEALLNFLVRLGWSHGDQEIFTIAEMIQFFEFDHVQKSSAVFNFEKLLWLNGNYIREYPTEKLQEILLRDFEADLITAQALPIAKSKLGCEILKLIQPKVKTLKEMLEHWIPLCQEGVVKVDPAELKWNKKPELRKPIEASVEKVIAMWSQKKNLDHVVIEADLKTVCEATGVKLGDLAQVMRLVITGRMVSVGLFELIPLLPWSLVEERLKQVGKL